MDTRSVLVPLDGSVTAEVVLPYATTVARALDADLRLLTVLDASHGSPQVEPGRAARESSPADYLLRHAEPLQVRGVKTVVATIAGDSIEQIVSTAEQPDVIVVAMATQGQSGMKRWYLGGVADAVLRTTTKSVLLVNPDATARTDRPVRLGRIVVPLDGSELAEAALSVAEALASAGSGAITLVHVLPPATAGPLSAGVPDGHTQTEAEAQQDLEAAHRKLRDASRASTLILRGTPSAAIAEHLITSGADLLVMTAHGRGGRKHLVLGSTAYRLLHAGPPLLLVRPPMSQSA
jgi:nucleotide-binding universal stress UspA family protein